MKTNQFLFNTIVLNAIILGITTCIITAIFLPHEQKLLGAAILTEILILSVAMAFRYTRMTKISESNRTKDFRNELFLFLMLILLSIILSKLLFLILQNMSGGFQILLLFLISFQCFFPVTSHWRIEEIDQNKKINFFKLNPNNAWFIWKRKNMMQI